MTSKIMDGNSAAAYIAYACNEIIAIYPITPSSNMAQLAEEKAANNDNNIWQEVPTLIEMQSEAGAAAAVHGAISAGALGTTFTSSQGLLLMIPNMHKVAGEFIPSVFYVAARTIASHALSIFCDHSDVMSIRNTGFALLFANSVQEVMDLSLVAQNATLETRIPFAVVFDGFRTSHELNKIEIIDYEQIKQFINQEALNAHRSRRLTPDSPHIQGTAQNPDVFFQAREAGNIVYSNAQPIIKNNFTKLAEITNRHYSAFEYVGSNTATHIIVAMGSACETIDETLQSLNNPAFGLIKVRLYRPFYADEFIQTLPASVTKIAVLDRTKEAGSVGEPLYLDIKTAIYEAWENQTLPMSNLPTIIGGRYGLGSKEFTPAMVKAVLDNLTADSLLRKKNFVVGIDDDITHSSLAIDKNYQNIQQHEFHGKFYGLGSDGTVSANKNSIKIIGEHTDKYVQAYFEYDSKKSGSYTISHLRFSDQPIQSIYLVEQANFIACHEFNFLTKYDILGDLEPHGTLLLASPYMSDKVWEHLPYEVQEQIISKNITVYNVPASKIAAETKMGRRINTIMQVAFFAISKIIPLDEAIAAIKASIKYAYAHKGSSIIERNFAAVDKTLDFIQQVSIPATATSQIRMQTELKNAPEFVQQIIAPMLNLKGNELPVSAMPLDGIWPSATSQYEKRNIAENIPQWKHDICTQCGYCTLVCPHSAIRMKVYDQAEEHKAPASFPLVKNKIKGFTDKNYSLQVYPEDCTGCEACVHICPVTQKGTDIKALNMVKKELILSKEKANLEFFQQLGEVRPHEVQGGIQTLKGSQLMQPLFEFSGACTGCGETPYIKLLTQLVGDRLMIANATGCSSIFGGNLPTTPYCTNAEGRGPAWANSLFEDNAEFALGIKLAENELHQKARNLLQRLSANTELASYHDQMVELLALPLDSEENIHNLRHQIELFKTQIQTLELENKDELLELIDHLVPKSVWAIGGDGWAYDIGYGGLDHVIASGNKVKILILDTESYSNTGGQMSKATPDGAVAKLATNGKGSMKKDLGLMLMNYQSVYIAQICLAANPMQAIKAFSEAEAYDGPAVIIAYSTCIAHGMDMTASTEHQKKAVQSGYWPLYRYNPQLKNSAKNPLQLDSKEPAIPLVDFLRMESRFKFVQEEDVPAVAEHIQLKQDEVSQKFKYLQHLARFNPNE